MFEHKIRVSSSIIGNTGYNNHAKSFFKELSKRVPLEIRNFTVGSSWKDYSDEPHNDEPYVDDTFKTLLSTQSLWNDKKELQDFPIYTKYQNPKKPSIDLVLEVVNHHYFYQDYSNYKIGYSVWEATKIPDEFFNRLLTFNEVWVPSNWQKDCLVKQGFPSEKIFIVPEGVDTETFKPEEAHHTLTSNPKRFTFGLFGRWDYRKSTKEIIETFLNTFDPSEPVDLIVSIDNPFSGDNLKTTYKRLEHYDLLDSRIKILSLAPREEYVSLMKSINVFLSCSRSEGWNLPLIEAMACGTPAIYSNCCAQLEFAEGKGLPVKVLGERPVKDSDYNHFNSSDGNYYEPDFADLSKVMRDAYENWKEHKAKALIDAKIIHKNFNWEKVAKDAYEHLEARKEAIEAFNSNRDFQVNYNFTEGPFVEIKGSDPGKFDVEFIDNKTNKVEYSATINTNMWSRGGNRYYKEWKIIVRDHDTNEVLFNKTMDLTGHRVYVAIDSSSLGDSLAWFPPIEEFRKKHKCEMICSTYHNDLFKDNYPQIKFINPGEPVYNVHAAYHLGWYYKEVNKEINGEVVKSYAVDSDMLPNDFRTQPMQKSAFDILGIDFKETKPIISIPKVKKKKQIAIAIHATAQAKYWNRVDGWQDVVDFCKNEGYEVVLLSKEEDGFMGNIHPDGIYKIPAGELSEVIAELAASSAFVGIGSGLSWLSWAIGTPTVLVSGFSYPYTESHENTFRVFAPDDKCSGCFNRHRLQQDNWQWCPDHANTEKEFECTRSISAEIVIDELKKALNIV